jgi:hypothetical protein
MAVIDLNKISNSKKILIKKTKEEETEKETIKVYQILLKPKVKTLD